MTVDISPVTRPRNVPLREALGVWVQVAFSSFGGPAVQIAVLYRILVEEKRWISERRFLNALNYCMAIPGPEAQLLATYVGWLMHRTLGGIIAGGVFILPGMICMMALSYGYVSGKTSPISEALFFGLKPAVLVIILSSMMQIGKRVLQTRWMNAIALLAFIGTFFFSLSFVVIVFAAAFLGLGVGLADKAGFHGAAALAPAYGTNGATTAGSLAEDELPDFTRPTVARFLRMAAFWLALWLVPVVALLAILGPSNVFSQIAIFFSKTAILAFGGPYTVITYVAQQAVEPHHWIAHDEMQDGIAMGELVPGPVILVLQFVGFMAAYRDPGVLPPIVAGTLGGLLGTWVTFGPIFLLFFVVAPFIETLRNVKIVNATLATTTAAVLGVVFTFAIWFAFRTIFYEIEPVHVLWLAFNAPKVASLDPLALALAIAAAFAMFHFRLGIIATLVLSCVAAIGLFLLGVPL